MVCPSPTFKPWSECKCSWECYIRSMTIRASGGTWRQAPPSAHWSHRVGTGSPPGTPQLRPCPRQSKSAHLGRSPGAGGGVDLKLPTVHTIWKLPHYNLVPQIRSSDWPHGTTGELIRNSDLENHIPHFNMIPGSSVCTLKFERPCTRRQEEINPGSGNLINVDL